MSTYTFFTDITRCSVDELPFAQFLRKEAEKERKQRPPSGGKGTGCVVAMLWALSENDYHDYVYFVGRAGRQNGGRDPREDGERRIWKKPNWWWWLWSSEKQNIWNQAYLTAEDIVNLLDSSSIPILKIYMYIERPPCADCSPYLKQIGCHKRPLYVYYSSNPS